MRKFEYPLAAVGETRGRIFEALLGDAEPFGHLGEERSLLFGEFAGGRIHGVVVFTEVRGER